MVAPERLVSLLPTAAEANTTFGVSDMVSSDPQNQFDTNNRLYPPGDRRRKADRPASPQPVRSRTCDILSQPPYPMP